MAGYLVWHAGQTKLEFSVLWHVGQERMLSFLIEYVYGEEKFFWASIFMPPPVKLINARVKIEGFSQLVVVILGIFDSSPKG